MELSLKNLLLAETETAFEKELLVDLSIVAPTNELIGDDAIRIEERA
jgi:hypothetical protein